MVDMSQFTLHWNKNIWIFLYRTIIFGTAKGGTLTLSIYTNNSNTAWSISDLPEWISADVQKGTGDYTVTLTVHENTSTEEGRNCIFYVNSAETGWEYQIPTTIGQEAATLFNS